MRWERRRDEREGAYRKQKSWKRRRRTVGTGVLGDGEGWCAGVVGVQEEVCEGVKIGRADSHRNLGQR